MITARSRPAGDAELLGLPLACAFLFIFLSLLYFFCMQPVALLLYLSARRQHSVCICPALGHPLWDDRARSLQLSAKQMASLIAWQASIYTASKACQLRMHARVACIHRTFSFINRS